METNTTPQNEDKKPMLNKYAGQSLADLQSIDIRKISQFDLKQLVSELERQVAKITTNLNKIKKKNISLSKAIVKT